MGMRVHTGEGGGRERGNEGTRRPVANMGCVVPVKVCGFMEEMCVPCGNWKRWRQSVFPLAGSPGA